MCDPPGKNTSYRTISFSKTGFQKGFKPHEAGFQKGFIFLKKGFGRVSKGLLKGFKSLIRV